MIMYYSKTYQLLLKELYHIVSFLLANLNFLILINNNVNYIIKVF